jgi:hypothetical protein
MKMLLRLPSQLGRLSVIVPSVVGGSGGFVAGTQQVQGSRTVLNENRWPSRRAPLKGKLEVCSIM